MGCSLCSGGQGSLEKALCSGCGALFLGESLGEQLRQPGGGGSSVLIASGGRGALGGSAQAGKTRSALQPLRSSKLGRRPALVAPALGQWRYQGGCSQAAVFVTAELTTFPTVLQVSALRSADQSSILLGKRQTDAGCHFPFPDIPMYTFGRQAGKGKGTQVTCPARQLFPGV